MRRSKAQPLTDILHEFLRTEGLETPLNQHRLISAWPEVMGEAINKYTGEIFIQNQTLHVKIKSAPLKQDLMMGRESLVKQLNEHVGAQVITDIVFH
ncbi:MAG: DUF721 domain-containing protein [Bacteroidaceae bacterium]|nr:DUF721 domain-containing protein [Bacteroidaceae bacterium]